MSNVSETIIVSQNQEIIDFLEGVAAKREKSLRSLKESRDSFAGEIDQLRIQLGWKEKEIEALESSITHLKKIIADFECLSETEQIDDEQRNAMKAGVESLN